MTRLPVRKTAGWIYYVLYQILSLLFTLAGFIILLPLAISKSWYQRPGTSEMFPNRIVWAWKGWWTFPWCNEEDGIAGGLIPTTWSAYRWSAIRNPANGLRWLPGASATLTSKPVFLARSWGYVATYGWRQCVIWHGLRFGWLINPDADVGWRIWPILGRA